MTKIVEYIMLNYTWFLIGAIIILLAIIGSYADKTNFGQGKDKNKSDKNDLELENAEEVQSEEIIDKLPEADDPVDMVSKNEALTAETSDLEEETEENSENDLNNEVSEPDFNVDENVNNINSETSEYNTPVSYEELNSISNDDLVKKDENANINEQSNIEINTGTELADSNEHKLEVSKSNDFEENFNKFEEEFNTLLPKKDIIDTDLLDDIDGLSLDKTQKISLNDIPDLDDVELPKIKNLKTEDENIWKF